MNPVLILQLRPEDEASDNEFEAILAKSGLAIEQVRRIRLDQTPDLDEISLADLSGVIVGGGPACVSDPAAGKSLVDQGVESALTRFLPSVLESDFPFLGCCYGIGILAHVLGATVNKERHGEAVGAVDCRVTSEGRRDAMLDGIPDTFRAFVGHKEALQNLPEGCTWLVESSPCPYQMIRYRDNVYACQFHPEADGAGFEVRIRLYQHMGYFPPEKADELIAMCREECVEHASRVLQNFVRLCAAREASVSLDDLQWSRRLVVATGGSIDQKERLSEMVASNRRAIDDRDLDVYYLDESGARPLSAAARALDERSVAALRSRLQESREHENDAETELHLVLIGKDGGKKRAGNTPEALTAFFDAIDGMPMRQAERRERGYQKYS